MAHVLRKRTRTNTSQGRLIVAYDAARWDALLELAHKEGTNASSVVNNLVDDLLARTNAQTTLGDFDGEDKWPSILAGASTWAARMDTASDKDIEDLKSEFRKLEKELRRQNLKRYGKVTVGTEPFELVGER